MVTEHDMQETATPRPGRTIRKFSSHAEQEAETIRYSNQSIVLEELKAE